jgi:hypothetical protein
MTSCIPLEICNYSLTHSLTLSLSLSHTHKLSLSLSHTHTHTQFTHVSSAFTRRAVFLLTRFTCPILGQCRFSVALDLVKKIRDRYENSDPEVLTSFVIGFFFVHFFVVSCMHVSVACIRAFLAVLLVLLEKYVRICIFMCTHTHTHTKHTHTHIHTHTCIYVHVYLHIYISIYLYKYVFIHTHTHIQTITLGAYKNFRSLNFPEALTAFLIASCMRASCMRALLYLYCCARVNNIK